MAIKKIGNKKYEYYPYSTSYGDGKYLVAFFQKGKNFKSPSYEQGVWGSYKTKSGAERAVKYLKNKTPLAYGRRVRILEKGKKIGIIYL